MNPFELFKNMQNLQQQMQSKLDGIEASGSSGGGMVEVKVNGKMEVQSIHIEPEIVDPNDVKTLEVLVAAAFNQAVKEVQDILQKEAMGMAGNMNIPAAFKG
ncbi:MAG: YbaB/EbfC family nucleoid-associated protein [Sphaerochaetaceae bacterium]|nr:YbaB/EbfC family nucleoid-associated protein [Sphaerochaetaceae bacterium]